MKKERNIRLFIFIVVFILEFVAGYYINHVQRHISGDAISRVANAFYVLYLKPPHLASIGLVWNPLPSLLEIPILLLYKLYKPLASSGLAGVVVTALFASGTTVYIYNSFVKFRHSKWVAIIGAALYTFNPYIFLYGANGMSEAIFIFMIVWSIIHLTSWLEDGEYQHIVKISFALCFAFLTRYEAIPFIAGIAIIVAIVIFKNNEAYKNISKKKFSYAFAKTEGTWMILLTPAVFAVVIWLVYNYVITGNAFYFLNSAYSNVGQSGSITNDATVAAIIGHPLWVIGFIIKKTIVFLIPFSLIFINRILKKTLLRIDFLIVLILIISLYIMQFALLLKGLSAAWLRYYVYILPVTAAWLPYELEKVKSIWKISGMITTFSLTGALTLFVMINSDISPDQFNAFGVRREQLTITAQEEVADYINNEYPNKIIYTDSFTTFSIILNSNNPYNIIAPSNYDFDKILTNPKDSNIDIIIIPDPKTDLGKLDSINKKYPSLYEEGTNWCKLDKSFSNFRVFRVIH